MHFQSQQEERPPKQTLPLCVSCAFVACSLLAAAVQTRDGLSLRFIANLQV